MNKKELVEKIESLPSHTSITSFRPYVDKKIVLGLISQLDETQKPVVPQFVADWIEEVKPAYTLFAAMEYGNLKIDKWLGNNSNQETFALAWIFGYEVEKEKRYRVKMKGVHALSDFLNFQKEENYWAFLTNDENTIYRTHHTRKQLEEAGFGWMFDCKGLEVEEVEE